MSNIYNTLFLTIILHHTLKPICLGGYRQTVEIFIIILYEMLIQNKLFKFIHCRPFSLKINSNLSTIKLIFNNYRDLLTRPKINGIDTHLKQKNNELLISNGHLVEDCKKHSLYEKNIYSEKIKSIVLCNFLEHKSWCPRCMETVLEIEPEEHKVYSGAHYW